MLASVRRTLGETWGFDQPKVYEPFAEKPRFCSPQPAMRGKISCVSNGLRRRCQESGMSGRTRLSTMRAGYAARPNQDFQWVRADCVSVDAAIVVALVERGRRGQRPRLQRPIRGKRNLLQCPDSEVLRILSHRPRPEAPRSGLEGRFQYATSERRPWNILRDARLCLAPQDEAVGLAPRSNRRSNRIATYRNSATSAIAAIGAASAKKDMSAAPPSSAVEMTKFPKPPVKTVE
jgi:hypothetical protein